MLVITNLWIARRAQKKESSKDRIQSGQIQILLHSKIHRLKRKKKIKLNKSQESSYLPPPHQVSQKELSLGLQHIESNNLTSCLIQVGQVVTIPLKQWIFTDITFINEGNQIYAKVSSHYFDARVSVKGISRMRSLMLDDKEIGQSNMIHLLSLLSASFFA